MLLADRALTSRLLATSNAARWPKVTSRCKSTQEKGKQKRILTPSRARDKREEQKWSIRRAKSAPPAFVPWLTSRLQELEDKSSDPGFATFAKNLLSIVRSKSLHASLEEQTTTAMEGPDWRPSEHTKPLSLLRSLREAYSSNGKSAADLQLRYAYQGLLTNRGFSDIDLNDQQRLADLRYPVEWYPATRTIQRKFIMHVGPTNSGKTYQALKRLEQADSGIYAGPLRLLAHEVFTRLNAKGRKSDLITGDEKNEQEGASLKSCTVEMVPLNVDVDVAVIDEIQMIGHRERGWAWTQALLGLKAKEIHLCGEERSVPLVRELVASMGDKLEINTYKRLSPLETSPSLKGRLANLRKGDCVVVFSVVGIHAMKQDIEKATQKRVAIVYGSLPPEIRAQQAKLFNDPENDYDFLVASDAIGMGLNLAIKRIIFESVSKYNGSSHAILETAHLKQIAGRAGRYRTAAQAEGIARVQDNVATPKEQTSSPSVGLVTTMERHELSIVQAAMREELEPIMTAGIFPPTNVLMKFATYFPPSTDFSYILLRLHELSLMHPRYHLCTLRDQIQIADIIQPVRNLTTRDRIIFCSAPAALRVKGLPEIVAAFARCVGDNTSGALLDIPEINLDLLDEEIRIDRNYMAGLEALHQALILYLWLSYRFAGVFINQEMAFYVKKLVEEKLDKLLAEYSASKAIREGIRKMREKALRHISKLNQTVSEPDASQTRIEIPDLPSLVNDIPAEVPEEEELDLKISQIQEQVHGIGESAKRQSDTASG